MRNYKFDALLQQDGWLRPAYVGVDGAGTLTYLSTVAPKTPSAVEVVAGIALPGFQNAHSHAFQYAMAGLAEVHRAGTRDDFWSWREAMYRCALRINPDQLEAIATGLYAEMLRNGYTHVAEFHYLHHDLRGNAYENLAEMGERLVAAAKTAGIKITLVPVLYQRGNFGKDPEPRQRRFISKTVDEYFQLLDDSANAVLNYADARLGFGVHSLRAVDTHSLFETISHGPRGIPFHLHAAEQIKEVEDCLAYLKHRPISWLVENIDLNDRFHLVHCTHMNDSELGRLAASGANVVLCPGTEGNLGDGIFRLADFMKQGGSWSLGTDSHISLNPLEDLRWLDYAQRLTTHQRNTLDEGPGALITNTIISGRRAMAQSESNRFFEFGYSFDAAIFDAASPLLLRPGDDTILPALVYATSTNTLLGTIVNGEWVVRNRIHKEVENWQPKFKQAIQSLS